MKRAERQELEYLRELMWAILYEQGGVRVGLKSFEAARRQPSHTWQSRVYSTSGTVQLVPIVNDLKQDIEAQLSAEFKALG